MARISEQSIEKIRSTADIIEVISNYLELKKRGRNFFGLCPFHGEKTASFSVNSEKQIYKCFGCGVGGGVINFIMDIEGLDFINAIKYLADMYGIEIEISEHQTQTKDLVSQLFDLHNVISKIFLSNLKTEEGKKILDYFHNRGLTNETIKQFNLGYSLNQKKSLLSILRKDKIRGDTLKQSGLFIETKSGYIDRFNGRIMFSISNSSGKIVAFAGRIYEDNKKEAKYVNSPETSIYNKSKILYGLHETKHFIREKKNVIVVEGYLDFLQLFQSGIKNTVAISGTAFTREHALQIKRFCNTVYLAYDGDLAGIAAAVRAGYVLLRSGLSAYIVNMPKDLDPDDWVKLEGKKPFLNAIDNSKKTLLFHFENYKEDVGSTYGKASFVNDVLAELIQINNSIDRELYCKELSELVGVSYKSIFEELNILLSKKFNRKKIKNSTDTESKQKTSKQLLEFDLIRLCFSKDKLIRKYLFENVKIELLTTEFAKNIYENIYIHLNSENPPEVDLIMNKLLDSKNRNHLSELVFDLEKSQPTLGAAKECIYRLEINQINYKIQLLRQELKNESNPECDPISILKEIEQLQNQKNNIF